MIKKLLGVIYYEISEKDFRMALYKTHTLFNLCLALPLSLAAMFFLLNASFYNMGVFAGAFTYSTLFMNPDLDLANNIKLFSIRGFLTLPFRLYANVFKHRGLSHHILFGSITRIIWLAAWGILIFLIFYKTLPKPNSLYQFYLKNQSIIHTTFLAICVADWSHLLLDRKKYKQK